MLSFCHFEDTVCYINADVTEIRQQMLNCDFNFSEVAEQDSLFLKKIIHLQISSISKNACD